MFVFKGDVVRTRSGETGEITATWGVARAHAELRQDSDGRAVPIFQAEIAEVIRRAGPAKSKGRRKA